MKVRFNEKAKPITFSKAEISFLERQLYADLDRITQKENETIDFKESVVKKLPGFESNSKKTTNLKQQKLFEKHKQKFEKEFSNNAQTMYSSQMWFDYTFPLVVNSNTQFLTLPFDDELPNLTRPAKDSNLLLGIADRHKGEMSAGLLVAGPQTNFAAGLWVEISSNTLVDVFLRPLMVIDNVLGLFAFNNGYAGSMASVGATAIDMTTKKKVFERQIKLWEDGIWGHYVTRSKEDRVYLSQTSLGQISFGMLPKRRYAVCFWIFVSSQTVGVGLAARVVRAKIPLIVMNTLPPPPPLK